MVKIEFPDRIFGKKADEALERVLNAQGQGQEREKAQPQTSNLILKDYFFVPSGGIYLAKKRSLNNESWNNAIKQIYEQGVDVKGQRAEMPTPFEFMSGLIYVLDNENIPDLTKEEKAEFLDDILALKNVYRGNHLNARFGDNVVETATIENGKLVWKTNSLEPCLKKDCYADIRKINSQGLFTTTAGKQEYEQGKNAYFWYPRNTAVARWGAFSVRAGLYCDRGADYSYPALGVRLVVRPKGASSKTRS